MTLPPTIQESSTQHSVEQREFGTDTRLDDNAQARLHSEVDSVRYDDRKRYRVNTISIAHNGIEAQSDFLEVCGGSEILSQICRAEQLVVLPGATLHPADEGSRSYDLTQASDIRCLKRLIRERRPFHTHLSPVCRVFSQAYHARRDEDTDPNFLHDMKLAENIIELAHYIHTEQLHGCIEVPRGAHRFWKLEQVIALKRLPGWFTIDLDG